MTTYAPRLRYLLAKRGPRIAATLLVVGVLLLAAAGFVYATPPTTEVTDHTNRQTVTAELATAATVTGNTSLYRAGTTLHNQPVYLLESAPVANLSLTTALPGGSGSVDHRIELVYSATRDGNTFWQRTRQLATETTRADGTVTTTASLTMRDLRQQLSAYREELGQAGFASVAVRISVEYTTGPYEGTFTGTYPIDFGEGWYTLGTESFSRTHSTPVTHTRTLPVVTRLSFLVPAWGGLLLVFAGLVIGLAVRRLDGDADRDLLEEIHRNRYGEWISEGSLAGAPSESVVRVDSLEALVDVAIDTGKRVIYDPSTGRYAVLDGSVQYRYTPAPDDSPNWTDQSTDTDEWEWADSK